MTTLRIDFIDITFTTQYGELMFGTYQFNTKNNNWYKITDSGNKYKVSDNTIITPLNNVMKLHPNGLFN